MIDWGEWYERTDKGWAHEYLFIYEKLLKGVDVRSVLEIGILGGESLRMWADVFPQASVTGIDIDDCRSLMQENERLSVLHADAYQMATLDKLGTYDFIVEDGSHVLKHQCFTAEHYSKLLNPGGVFLIEDIFSTRDARTIQHFLPDEYHAKSYIIDRRGAPCGYPSSSRERNEIMVVLDLRD